MLQTPNQKAPDILNGVRNLVVKTSVKQSKREYFEKYGGLLFERAGRAKNLLREQNPGFGRVDINVYASAAVDKSVTGRVGVEIAQLDAENNRKLAYVGDAVLTQKLAIDSYRKGYTPEQYQDQRRSVVTSSENLAVFYMKIFEVEKVLITFEKDKDITDRQKAEYIEALIGALYEFGHPDLSYWLASKIIHME